MNDDDNPDDVTLATNGNDEYVFVILYAYNIIKKDTGIYAHNVPSPCH